MNNNINEVDIIINKLTIKLNEYNQKYSLISNDYNKLKVELEEIDNKIIEKEKKLRGLYFNKKSKGKGWVIKGIKSIMGRIASMTMLNAFLYFLLKNNIGITGVFDIYGMGIFSIVAITFMEVNAILFIGEAINNFIKISKINLNETEKSIENNKLLLDNLEQEKSKKSVQKKIDKNRMMKLYNNILKINSTLEMLVDIKNYEYDEKVIKRYKVKQKIKNIIK